MAEGHTTFVVQAVAQPGDAGRSVARASWCGISLPYRGVVNGLDVGVSRSASTLVKPLVCPRWKNSYDSICVHFHDVLVSVS
jgi:hypothetical protein